ncbi:conserved hypothetical protein [Hyella patelloides LEGE 07179]|uniref:Uncharacterized protein n=1 Tax=Hyella patelloides LEGE 07179 TaxID=945734 RepID=A0A563VZ17_9CYAN|nr:diiron oxygenase [Hyella patelloides]VEP16694.1 conserved hypothetical protein [Hyella patelloides LEGE 07179]
MENNAQVLIQSSSPSELPQKKTKHFQLIEKTYQSNIDSDYTEKIAELGKNFDYHNNSDRYWGNPELSTFYGTPLYEEASESQKLALNHLYWVGQYNHTANSEANTMLYNQITEGVFAHFGDYQTLCQELEFETSQERYHIRTFQKIGYKTKVALLGKSSLGNPLSQKSPQFGQFQFNALNSSLEAARETSFRWITRLMLGGNTKSYSRYLQEREGNSIPTTSGGLAELTSSPTAFKFFTLNWGSSPFLASQYYAVRMIANMSLKTYEHQYFKHFKKLEKELEFIPAPTAVSYYHLLDESFHTTMSQIIAQELYRDFPQPTAYEKLVANLTIYLAQKGVLGGLSGGLPAVFREDDSFFLSFYRLLQSPLFEMSSTEALQWMEKCLCQEHEGFHVNLKYHQRLLGEFRRFFERLDYLWAVNREMQIMASGGSIKRALKNNIKSWKQFFQQVAA